MISYVKTNACRSKIIGNYFNDLSIKSCGICDNCIKEKNIVVSTTEFENITMIIEKLTVSSPVHSNLLLKNLNTFKKEKVWKVLNYLQAENKICITEGGLVGKR